MNWEKVVQKLKFLGFLVLFAASIGATAYGLTNDVMAAAPAMEETPAMVLTKEVKPSGEIIFRLEPAEDPQYPLAEEDESEEEEIVPRQERPQKRFPVKWEEDVEEDPNEGSESPYECYDFCSIESTDKVKNVKLVASFEQEKQPTSLISDTGYKRVEQYAGSIDYEAILQGPIIYDFGSEGELALEWVVWHESRGEPFDGQVAVAASAINRCEGDCPWFPDKSSIIAILSQKYQFAYQYVSAENLAAYPDVHRAVQCAIRGADPTVCEAFPDGAQWYYNPAGTTATFSEADYELVIGHHHFHNYGYGWK